MFSLDRCWVRPLGRPAERIDRHCAKAEAMSGPCDKAPDGVRSQKEAVMIATTHPEMSVSEPTLYVAFELGKNDWKLAMTSGFGVTAFLRTVASGDLDGVERALRQGRQRLGLPAHASVVSCYEGGRDGFWIHRALTQRGIGNRVVDSASIEISRRARRAKTDRLDAL